MESNNRGSWHVIQNNLIASILQTKFSGLLSVQKFVFWFQFNSSVFTEIYLIDNIRQQLFRLGAVWQQAISWSKPDQIPCHHMTSIAQNE